LSFLPQEIIRTKRDGGELDPADIAAFIAGLTDGSVSEGRSRLLRWPFSSMA
jgi:thymidine phosphorylase